MWIEHHTVLPKWHHIFFTGLALWAASVLVTAVTRNVIMIPTVVLLGSFLVPVTAITWFLNHYEGPELTTEMIFYAVIVGGVLGTLSASLLESWLVGNSLFVGVGLIEEFTKLLALILVARRLVHRTGRDRARGDGRVRIWSAGEQRIRAGRALRRPRPPAVALSRQLGFHRAHPRRAGPRRARVVDRDRGGRALPRQPGREVPHHAGRGWGVTSWLPCCTRSGIRCRALPRC